VSRLHPNGKVTGGSRTLPNKEHQVVYCPIKDDQIKETRISGAGKGQKHAQYGG